MIEDYASLVRKIEAYIAEQRFEVALTLCSRSLIDYPDSYELQIMIAELFFLLSRKHDGEKALKDLIRKLNECGEFLKSIACIKRLQKWNPSEANDALFLLARHFVENAEVMQHTTDEQSMPSFSKERDLKNTLRRKIMNHDELIQTHDILPAFKGEVTDEFQQDQDPLGMNSDETILDFISKERSFDFVSVNSYSENHMLANESGTFEHRRMPSLPSFFSQLSVDSLFIFLSKMDWKTFSSDQEIIRQGAIGNELFILVRGTVGIIHSVAQDKEKVGSLSEGEFFGEISLLTPLRRTASVVSNEACEILSIRRHDFEEIAAIHPSIREELQRFVYSRLIQNLLVSSLLFFPLPDSKRWEFAHQFSVVDIPEGVTLIEEGGNGVGLFLIAGGEVGMYKLRSDGTKTPLFSFGPGQFFGEFSLITNQKSMCSVVSTEACKLLFLPFDTFHKTIKAYPRVLHVLKAISKQRIDEIQAFEYLWHEFSLHMSPVT